MIKDYLARYPNTYEYDLSELEKHDKEKHLTPNQKNIITLRFFEK